VKRITLGGVRSVEGSSFAPRRGGGRGSLVSEGALSSHFPLLDAFRGIAAISVFAYHAPQIPGVFGKYLSQRTTGWPTLGATVFFLISGFLIYRPFVQARHDGLPMPRLLPYAARRFFRIVPAYWVALPIVALVLSESYVFTPGGLLRYFGFLQVYSSHTEQQGIAQGWTIGVEVTFYIALALIAVVMARRPARSERNFLATELGMCAALFVGSIVWQIVALAIVPVTSAQIYASVLSLPGTFDWFALGMALAVLSVAVGDSRPPVVALIDRAPWLPWLIAAGINVIMVHQASIFTHGRTVPWVGLHLLRGACAFFILLPAIWGVWNRGWVRKLLAFRPLAWGGKTSYGFYLWHVMVLTELADAGLHGGWLFVAALAGSYVMGALSWYGIERHALRFARRLSGVPPAAVDLATPAAPYTEVPDSEAAAGGPVVLGGAGAPPPGR
jgi:peptidoglycan/LPS O-acetylase OafA/YrhL